MKDGHLVAGLVGQVCAGKSAVSAAFCKRGAALYDADKVVHELYGREDVKKEVRALLGDGVFDAQGKVDRKKVGAVVFGDESKLKALTDKVIYPRTGEVLERMLKEFCAGKLAGNSPVLIVDAPTLFEAGREGKCARILFVGAPREHRERWAQAQRGWTPDVLARREARMLDEGTKRARCTDSLENDGSLDDLDRKVGALWKKWLGEGRALV